MQRIWRTRVVLAIRKPLVALSPIRIGNQRWHVQRGKIRLTVVESVGREHRRARAQRREHLDDWQQQRLLGARPMRLRVNNDLVFRIHRSHARVALDDARIRRHLRAVVIRAVAFPQPTRRAIAIRAVVFAATSGSSSKASVSRCRSRIVCAACSNISARCVNSARARRRGT